MYLRTNLNDDELAGVVKYLYKRKQEARKKKQKTTSSVTSKATAYGSNLISNATDLIPVSSTSVVPSESGVHQMAKLFRALLRNRGDSKQRRKTLNH